MRAMLIKLGVAAVVGYVTLVGGLYTIQRDLIYVPSAHRPEPARYGVPEMRAVTLKTVDGLDLLAWWHPPDKATRPVILYFHGNGGHVGHHAARLRRYMGKGWGVLIPAWRGYSGNAGRPTEQGLYADGRAALAFLSAARIEQRRLVLYGHSLGTGVAVQMAIEAKERAVVLEAPFSSLADIARSRYPFAPVGLLLKDRYDSIAKVGDIGAPLLLIHGDKDTVIPARFGHRLFEAAVQPKQAHFLPAGSHNNLYRYGAAEKVIKFIEKHVNSEN